MSAINKYVSIKKYVVNVDVEYLFECCESCDNSMMYSDPYYWFEARYFEPFDLYIVRIVQSGLEEYKLIRDDIDLEKEHTEFKQWLEEFSEYKSEQQEWFDEDDRRRCRELQLI